MSKGSISKKKKNPTPEKSVRKNVKEEEELSQLPLSVNVYPAEQLSNTK
jgi:hypothetical protein